MEYWWAGYFKVTNGVTSQLTSQNLVKQIKSSTFKKKMYVQKFNVIYKTVFLLLSYLYADQDPMDHTAHLSNDSSNCIA